MATNASSILIRHTGASTHDGAQPDPDLMLGNHLASDRFDPLGVRVENGIPNIEIVTASGLNGTGTGALTAVGDDTVTWTAPGSATPGAAVTITNGQTKYVFGTDTDKWIKITRNTTDALAGAMSVRCKDVFNSMMLDWTNAQRNAGETVYRAIGLEVNAGDEAGHVIAWLSPLGAQATSSGAHPSTGAITLSCNETDGYIDWPGQGGVKNVTTGAVMYYSSRTDSAITIAAASRDVWADGNQAVGTSDVLRPVSMLRLGFEVPASQTSGAFQTIASETTSPTGITFKSATAFDDDPAVGSSFASGEIVCVWVQHRILAGAEVDAAERLRFHLGWYPPAGWFAGEGWFSGGGWFDEVDATVTPGYENQVRSVRRAEDTTLKTYLLFRGADASPDPEADTPAEEFDTLPHTTALTYSSSTTYHHIVRKQNRFGIRSKNIAEWKIILDGSGDQEATKPSNPDYVDVSAAAAGTVNVEFIYNSLKDLEANRGTHWAVWYTADGSNPDLGTPASHTEQMSLTDGLARLAFTVPAQSEGATVKVVVRVYRDLATDVYSDSTRIDTVTATLLGPAAASSSVAMLGEAAEAK